MASDVVGLPSLVASSVEMPTSPPVTVRLTVKTNWPEANQYFYIDRISDAPTPEEEWNAPNPVPVNGGFEFYVDLPTGARYLIGLEQPEGADFTLPSAQEVDLRSPSVSQLERTLEFSNIGESGQI